MPKCSKFVPFVYQHLWPKLLHHYHALGIAKRASRAIIQVWIKRAIIQVCMLEWKEGVSHVQERWQGHLVCMSAEERKHSTLIQKKKTTLQKLGQEWAPLQGRLYWKDGAWSITCWSHWDNIMGSSQLLFIIHQEAKEQNEDIYKL